MKVKQSRRWRKRNHAEQQTLSHRIIGQTMLTLLLCGTIVSTGTFFLSKQKGSTVETTAITAPVRASLDSALAEKNPAKDFFLRLRTNWAVSMGNARVGNVYLTEERLLECPEKLDTVQLAETANILGDLYQTYQLPTYVIAVPSAGEFYASNHLPSGEPFHSQIPDLDAFYAAIPSPIRKIDVYHILFTMTDDNIYNRTDPRWTCYGAYCVYQNAIRKMGFAPISFDQYVVTHTGTFRGSLYDACLYESITPDSIDRYICESGSTITQMTAYLADGTTEERTMYQEDDIFDTDPYTYYLGESCEKMVIQTDVDNQKKLLLLKDSYADCMVPFLLQHYSEICLIDVSCMEHSLEELADVSSYHQILVLCDADTYADKNSFSKLFPS